MRIIRVIGRRFVPALAAGLCAIGLAAQPPSPQEQALIDGQVAWLAAALQPPEDQGFDRDLVLATRQLVDEHLLHARSLLGRWLTELRPLNLPPPRLDDTLWLRLLNELAWWPARPAGAEHDAAWLAALRQPAVCLPTGPDHPIALHLRVLQHMPADARAAALAGLRRQFQAWGSGEPEMPPHDLELADALSRLRRGGPRPEAALPPAVAIKVLGRDETVLADLSAASRCAAQRWWLMARLDQGMPAAQALAEFRRGHTTRIQHFTPPPAPGKAAADDDFPAAAARNGIEGTVQVAATVDGAGQVLDARIVGRQLAAPHVPARRPLGFEEVFDWASVLRARRVPPAPHASDKVSDGRRTTVVTYVWKLQ